MLAEVEAAYRKEVRAARPPGALTAPGTGHDDSSKLWKKFRPPACAILRPSRTGPYPTYGLGPIVAPPRARGVTKAGPSGVVENFREGWWCVSVPAVHPLPDFSEGGRGSETRVAPETRPPWSTAIHGQRLIGGGMSGGRSARAQTTGFVRSKAWAEFVVETLAPRFPFSALSLLLPGGPPWRSVLFRHGS
jgi:hypothetical protein